jgi:hypothetical protein
VKRNHGAGSTLSFNNTSFKLKGRGMLAMQYELASQELTVEADRTLTIGAKRAGGFFLGVRTGPVPPQSPITNFPEGETLSNNEAPGVLSVRRLIAAFDGIHPQRGSGNSGPFGERDN